MPKNIPRIPLECGGIQLNFCKNPACPNYGLPASAAKQPRGPGSASHPNRDPYRISGPINDGQSLICLDCGASTTIKSNLAINEEIARLAQYLRPTEVHGCKNPTCKNFGKAQRAYPHLYYVHTKTAAKSRRYQCKDCKKTFTISKPRIKQTTSHLNKTVFKILVGKMPLNCIMEFTELSPKTVYDKIDFIYRQCEKFVANRERKLLMGMVKLPELEISCDRQEYVVNWTNQFDKRNIRLLAMGSADNISSYVFGLHLNFDSALLPEDIEPDAKARRDFYLPMSLRKYARLWIEDDYKRSASRGQRVLKTGKSVEEAKEELDGFTQLPKNGMQVHAEYTMIGHYFLLKELIKASPRVTFYLDRESGIEGIVCGVFDEEIREEKVQAYLVAINKNCKRNERERLVKEARDDLEYFGMLHYPYGLSHDDLAVLLMESRLFTYMSGQSDPVPWSTTPFFHPLPKKSEPEKQVTFISNQRVKSDQYKLGVYFVHASLGGVERIFQQLRRKLSLLERGIPTSNNRRRIWHGYAPYNPQIIAKVLMIYRVYYNYVKVGDDGKTPAMRLGLAKSKVTREDILYFE